eukprot:CAMPEP_0115268570 /NCGR_PEP_ID=MMETSP0270-20121206/52588_1 /TAXON_ID=71861 /ORGANISM="Scrippsiella trochoidea, Strain CCMP3099" /LENGTH=42 /DNA_ID= /DNA_START= /DNA_END= /DNA_ORIENTATION=
MAEALAILVAPAVEGCREHQCCAPSARDAAVDTGPLVKGRTL